jgi:hypothetical protein
LVVVQCDECVVKSQIKEAGKDVWVFTGVVNTSVRTYYFTADSAEKLFHQIGALLALLNIHEGNRDILVLGDGARWIRKWYREIPLVRKELRLCWFHLTEECKRWSQTGES